MMIRKLCVLGFAFLSLNSYACSRLMFTTDQGTFVGRTMDWPMKDMNTNLVIFPRGTERVGDPSGKDGNALNWRAKYGSVVASGYVFDATDGINEKGLVGHELWLEASDYGKRDISKPGVSVVNVLQYYLDNFASVDELVRFTQYNRFQIIAMYYPPIKKVVKLHFAFEDKSGDSAIIEFINGKPSIHHGKQFNVMTNDPVYDAQLANLKEYIGFGGKKYLPGGPYTTDRFVRGSYYLSRIGKAESPAEDIKYMRSIVDNIVHPYVFIKRPDGSVYGSHTIWRTFVDVNHLKYYFGSMKSLNIISVDLNKIDFRSGTGRRELSVNKHLDYAGDVTSKFNPA